jgi:hypothetical protein
MAALNRLSEGMPVSWIGVFMHKGVAEQAATPLCIKPQRFRAERKPDKAFDNFNLTLYAFQVFRLAVMFKFQCEGFAGVIPNPGDHPVLLR